MRKDTQSTVPLTEPAPRCPSPAAQQIRLAILGSGTGAPAESDGERPGRGCHGRAPSTAGRCPPPWANRAAPLGDSDEALGPVTPAYMEQRSEKGAGSRFQGPARLGSRPRVPGFAAARPWPWGPPGPAQGGAGLPGPRHRRKAKEKKEKKENPERMDPRQFRQLWLGPGRPDRRTGRGSAAGSRSRLPRTAPGLPGGDGCAEGTGRSGRTVPLPGKPGGTQTQGWKNPLRLCPCLAPAPCLPSSRPHSRPAALHTAVPKAPACPWRCAPAAAAALLRTPRSVPAQEGALGRLSRGFPAGPGWGQLPAAPPSPALPVRPAGRRCRSREPPARSHGHRRAQGQGSAAVRGKWSGAPVQPPGRSSKFHFFFPSSSESWFGSGFFLFSP